MQRLPIITGLALLLATAVLLARPTPVLVVTPTQLAFSTTLGTFPSAQTVSVSNAGKGSVKWVVSTPTVQWLKITPTSGTNTGSLSVSIIKVVPVGSYSTTFTVRGNNGQTWTVAVALTMTSAPPPPPPVTLTYGPQSTITCPAGAINIGTSDSIQTAVNNASAGASFCLAAGTHAITSGVTPKTGDTFTGAYGAIIDGTGWSTSDPNSGAFMAHNQDIDNVTIRNLVIQNMPQKGIHVYYNLTSGWDVENNEIKNCVTGIEMGATDGLVRNNYIHDNTGGGYSAFRSTSVTYEHNEIGPNNGGEQKVVQADSAVFLNNYVHDNTGAGIWYDTDNVGSVIDSNTVSDNGAQGIFYEISGGGVIRYNTVTNSGDVAIFISTSKSVDIYGNTLTGNFRGIEFFLNCTVIGQGAISYDLTNDAAHENTINVPSTSGAFGNGFSYNSGCPSGTYTPYLSLQKGLTFAGNKYTVPSLTGKYWVWGFGNLVTWTQWRALPQDATGTVQ